MTQENIVTQNNTFDFAQFQQEAIEKIKAGQPLMGGSGVITPLIKQIIEASLEAEIEQHMDNCVQENVTNRRNGKTTKTVQTGHGPIPIFVQGLIKI